MTEDRTALLIIRARIEAHPSASLRARVRWTMDIAGGFARPADLADADAVTELVRGWLRDVEAAGRQASR